MKITVKQLKQLIKEEIQLLLRSEKKEVLEEKWAKEVDVKQTGEHAEKTVAQIRKRLAALKKKEDKTEAEKKEQKQLLFALRAKTGWKKGEGATKKEE